MVRTRGCHSPSQIHTNRTPDQLRFHFSTQNIRKPVWCSDFYTNIIRFHGGSRQQQSHFALVSSLFSPLHPLPSPAPRNHPLFYPTHVTVASVKHGRRECVQAASEGSRMSCVFRNPRRSQNSAVPTFILF